MRYMTEREVEEARRQDGELLLSGSVRIRREIAVGGGCVVFGYGVYGNGAEGKTWTATDAVRLAEELALMGS